MAVHYDPRLDLPEGVEIGWAELLDENGRVAAVAVVQDEAAVFRGLPEGMYSARAVLTDGSMVPMYQGPFEVPGNSILELRSLHLRLSNI